MIAILLALATVAADPVDKLGATATTAGTPATAAAAPARPAAARERRYCIIETPLTGSFIHRKTCRTRSEWQQMGVDIPA